MQNASAWQLNFNNLVKKLKLETKLQWNFTEFILVALNIRFQHNAYVQNSYVFWVIVLLSFLFSWQ